MDKGKNVPHKDLLDRIVTALMFAVVAASLSALIFVDAIVGEP